MKPEEHLKDRLTNCSKADLRPVDQEFLDKNGMEEMIYRLLTSKKFRKWSVMDTVEQKVRRALSLCIPENKPIKFSCPFGGYKLWRLASAPEVDWAEYFMIAYNTEYIAPILKIYKPGVELIFTSDAVILERMNNISKTDSNLYFDSFKALLNKYRQYLPNNFSMDIVRIADLYENEQKLHEEVDRLIPEIEAEYKAMGDKETNLNLITSELNIQWQGAEDWSKYTDEEKKEKIRIGPIIHDAYCRISKRAEYIKGDDKIMVFTTPGKSSIPIGTTKTSVTKFWTGFGVLEKKGDSYFDRVLSPQQFDKIKDQPHEVVQTDLIPLKNFKEIWVYPEELRFS
ncbi:hypothetical protein KKG41_06340 [Patescibacteria group bacterium]|nr:hypothetical protein [Patescibacteria group bacterium]MBU1890769.1 hypothetical protein [Patescibacteria group bacterium]